MKRFILGIVLIGSLSTHANVTDFKEERTHLFNISALDAVECEGEVIGDHLHNASVTQVNIINDEGYWRFFEINDGHGFYTRCSSNGVKKLTSYFDKIVDGKKTKSAYRAYIDRPFSCIVDSTETFNHDFIIKNNLDSKVFIDVRKVYGAKTISQYESQVLGYALYSSEGEWLTECHSVTKPATVQANERSRKYLGSFNAVKESFKNFILGISAYDGSAYHYNSNNTLSGVGTCTIGVKNIRKIDYRSNMYAWNYHWSRTAYGVKIDEEDSEIQGLTRGEMVELLLEKTISAELCSPGNKDE